MTKPSIAFLGLGLMGHGMARRLLGAGYPLTVFNRNASAAAPLAGEGARVAQSPRDAAAHGQIVIAMVADDAASRAVWLGDNGALAGVAPRTTLIDSSTLSVAWVNELAAAANNRGCELLDAPVTGSKGHAAAGELHFLVGGSAETLAIARPTLEVMSLQITHLGPTGSGALMKLINNFICGVQAASLAEGLALIERSHLNRDQALAVLTNGAPGSPLLKALSTRMTAANFTPNFVLRLMAKDLAYAIGAAKNHHLELKTAAAALEMFKGSIASGDGEKDFSSVIERLRRK